MGWGEGSRHPRDQVHFWIGVSQCLPSPHPPTTPPPPLPLIRFSPTQAEFTLVSQFIQGEWGENAELFPRFSLRQEGRGLEVGGEGAGVRLVSLSVPPRKAKHPFTLRLPQFSSAFFLQLHIKEAPNRRRKYLLRRRDDYYYYYYFAWLGLAFCFALLCKSPGPTGPDENRTNRSRGWGGSKDTPPLPLPGKPRQESVDSRARRDPLPCPALTLRK